MRDQRLGVQQHRGGHVDTVHVGQLPEHSIELLLGVLGGGRDMDVVRIRDVLDLEAHPGQGVLRLLGQGLELHGLPWRDLLHPGPQGGQGLVRLVETLHRKADSDLVGHQAQLATQFDDLLLGKTEGVGQCLQRRVHFRERGVDVAAIGTDVLQLTSQAEELVAELASALVASVQTTGGVEQGVAHLVGWSLHPIEGGDELVGGLGCVPHRLFGVLRSQAHGLQHALQATQLLVCRRRGVRQDIDRSRGFRDRGVQSAGVGDHPVECRPGAFELVRCLVPGVACTPQVVDKGSVFGTTLSDHPVELVHRDTQVFRGLFELLVRCPGLRRLLLGTSPLLGAQDTLPPGGVRLHRVHPAGHGFALLDELGELAGGNTSSRGQALFRHAGGRARHRCLQLELRVRGISGGDRNLALRGVHLLVCGDHAGDQRGCRHKRNVQGTTEGVDDPHRGGTDARHASLDSTHRVGELPTLRSGGRVRAAHLLQGRVRRGAHHLHPRVEHADLATGGLVVGLHVPCASVELRERLLSVLGAGHQRGECAGELLHEGRNSLEAHPGGDRGSHQGGVVFQESGQRFQRGSHSLRDCGHSGQGGEEQLPTGNTESSGRLAQR